MKQKFWITRDSGNNTYDNTYNDRNPTEIYAWDFKKKPKLHVDCWSGDFVNSVCALGFMKRFKIRLKKGDIKLVEVIIKEVK